METRGVASMTYCNYGFQPVVVKATNPGPLAFDQQGVNVKHGKYLSSNLPAIGFCS